MAMTGIQYLWWHVGRVALDGLDKNVHGLWTDVLRHTTQQTWLAGN
jgi:hypothetical protein